MRRLASLLVLVALACGLLGVASASSSASRRYEASGDPILVCAVNGSRPSSKGACFPVPSDAWEAQIVVRDDSGAFASFTVDFVNAAGLPLDPMGHVQSTIGVMWGGSPQCGFGTAGVPSGATYMRVNLVASSSLGCVAASSGLINVDFVPGF